jgi:hypothetical protein
VGVISATQGALRSLLATPGGLTALASVDPAKRLYLGIYGSKAAAERPMPAGNVSGALPEDLDSSHLWEVRAGKNFKVI